MLVGVKSPAGARSGCRGSSSANTLEPLFSAEPFDADDAFRIGLINGKTERGGLDFEKSMATSIYCAADKHEGISSFFEKRKPHYKGE
jgi:hypothetical protein